MADKITPRSEDYGQWYVDVVRNANLADYSPVRGSMIIPPYGYALWENMQRVLDGMFKATGHQNAYFPLFIPMSFLAKEAEHVEGFAKECAVVTHHRLSVNEAGELGVDPAAKLEEPLIVRPTSETIIWDTYSRWIQSWRDLPILINQWANVVRWEMRTRLFLRTAEFLWQEGHTAHATKDEAVEETLKMLDVYTAFAEEYMALPVIRGVKTASERFAGAVDTYCIESLMQDKKALQAGTSHFLGQNFARAFDCTFQNKEGHTEHVWATSWGVSTRLIGALIMSHSDDQGLILPPRLAPVHVVIVPIYRKEGEAERVLEVARSIERDLNTHGVRVEVDNRDQYRPGYKFNEHEVRGVPIRLALGPRDLESGTIELARRDVGTKETVSQSELTDLVPRMLEEIQMQMFDRALAFRKEHTHRAESYDDLKRLLDKPGGFVLMHWDGSEATEAQVKEETKATIRCIPLDGQFEPEDDKPGTDPVSGKPSERRVLYARAY
ncbi:proline--tRNA ligase [soil metagenome]